jgi:hypothetical protein
VKGTKINTLSLSDGSWAWLTQTAIPGGVIGNIQPGRTEKPNRVEIKGNLQSSRPPQQGLQKTGS